jgi:hypothetical protein
MTKYLYAFQPVQNMVLVGKPTGKKPLGRPIRRCDNITILKKWDANVDWIYLAQNKNRGRALVKAVTIFWAP